MWQATHAPLLRALGATTPAALQPLRGMSQEELFARDAPFPTRAQDQMWVALNRPEVAGALGAEEGSSPFEQFFERSPTWGAVLDMALQFAAPVAARGAEQAAAVFGDAAESAARSFRTSAVSPSAAAAFSLTAAALSALRISSYARK